MCGTEDFVYADNQRFLQVAKKSFNNFEYQEGPGNHDWDYWEAAIGIVLQRFAAIYAK